MVVVVVYPCLAVLACARLSHPYMRTCENSISCLSSLSQSPVPRLALFRLTSHSPVFLCSYSNLRYRKHNFKVFTLLLVLLSLLFSFANPSSLQVILKVLGNKLGLDLRFYFSFSISRHLKPHKLTANYLLSVSSPSPFQRSPSFSQPLFLRPQLSHLFTMILLNPQYPIQLSIPKFSMIPSSLITLETS